MRALNSNDIPSSSQISVGWLSARNILIVANTLVFFAMLFNLAYLKGPDNTPVAGNFSLEQLLRWGANYGPYTLGGQYWRVVTSVFLHLNILHLAWNMLFLWRLGGLVQRLLGNAITFAIYILTGIGGSLLSLSWHPTTVSVGASGAVF